MQSNLTRGRFALLCRKAGIPLSVEERRDAFEAYAVLREMVAGVHTPAPDAGPAMAFDVGEGW